jgi:heme exporter protein C
MGTDASARSMEGHGIHDRAAVSSVHIRDRGAGVLMRKAFLPLLILTAVLFAYAPIAIANAPYESTMLLIQKIFYFHVPAWIAMYSAIFVCGIASAVYLFKGRADADRIAVAAGEIAVLFGLMGLITGPLWGRKAWGVWWQWDARLTTALLLELILIAYLLVRKYGGPGSEKLSAGLALFGMVDSVFVYKAVDWWRTVHPKTTVVTSLVPGMMFPFALCSVAFVLLFALILMLRVRLANLQSSLNELYLAQED